MLPPLRYLSKPALLAALIIFFVRQKNTLTQSSNMLFLAALLCSLLGDRLLLFEHLGQWFFMAGLSAFLIAHFMYSAVFLAHRDSHQYVGYCGDDELRLIKNKNHKPNQLLLGAGRRRFICCIR
jgi:uncharacterized membrane protein YhhN